MKTSSLISFLFNYPWLSVRDQNRLLEEILRYNRRENTQNSSPIFTNIKLTAFLDRNVLEIEVSLCPRKKHHPEHNVFDISSECCPFSRELQKFCNKRLHAHLQFMGSQQQRRSVTSFSHKSITPFSTFPASPNTAKNYHDGNFFVKWLRFIFQILKLTTTK